MNISIENFTSPEVHPSSDLIPYLRIGLLCFNLLFAVPTHCYIIWTIARGGRIPAEFFNVNLSVCEIIYSMVFLFYLLQVVTNLESMQFFFQGLGVCGRPLFQCLICVERYLAVVHPVTFLKYKPLRYRVICSVIAWIITFISCLGGSIIQIVSNIRTYSWFFSLQYFIFLSIQLFCLVAVLRALKQSGPGERGEEREENHMKKRAFHLILITTVTMVVMFVPFIVTGFLCILQPIEQNDLIWFLSLCSFILTGFVQPVLYLHRSRKLYCLCSS